MLLKHIEIDEKNLKPLDTGSWDDFPEANLAKPEIGRVRITNLKSGEVTNVNNLVLLPGREILLQKLLGTGDKINYNIRYFQVGDGGCTVGTTPSKIGPFDDDMELKHAVSFNAGNILDNGSYTYIHGGKSKHIKADGGNIEIINEKHTISKIDGSNSETIEADYKTTVKFTMYIKPNECYSKQPDGTDYTSRTFRFNEAALLLVDTDTVDNDIPAGATDEAKFNANFSVFARFTTLNKYLEAQDGIKIEWFILV